MVEFAPLGANKILCGGGLAVIQNNVLLDKTMNFFRQNCAKLPVSCEGKEGRYYVQTAAA